MTKKRLVVIAAFLIVAGIALWFALAGPESEEAKDILDGRERLVLLDGKELADTVVSPEAGDGLRHRRSRRGSAAGVGSFERFPEDHRRRASLWAASRAEAPARAPFRRQWPPPARRFRARAP